ncbi:hypothetical protein [Wolbachia endosymbiont (group B) of Sphaerophoria taeniata]|uniref:hypothetical protein n=1 Tax=Wolbachia endosymbiont (group B) of Sphaerophoria taeniata TaxID=2954058 RepID=UPI0022206504|nr:hypothetical protein [Wolbachia endosymbiont (group B) of Sphaerophoria taeniata]
MSNLRLSCYDIVVHNFTTVQTFVCESSVLNIIADFASNTKMSSQCPSNKDNIANLEFKRVIPRELLRQKAGVEFVYNVDLGGFYE